LIQLSIEKVFEGATTSDPENPPMNSPTLQSGAEIEKKRYGFGYFKL
jgi:hypothetical protein